MSEEKLLTVREVAKILNITERQVIELAEEGKLCAYKVAGVYLRFRRQDVEEFKKKREETTEGLSSAGIKIKERIIDFLYFNDFYILSLILIIWLVIIILKTQQ